MKKLLLVTLIALTACKHQPEDVGETVLNITPQQVAIYEGDSLQLILTENNVPVSQPVSWSTSYGSITSSGLLISESIQTDTLLVTVTATYNGRQTGITLPLIKKAFLSPEVSFSQTVLPIFVSNCNFTGCHGNGSRASKVELSCYDSVFNAIIPYNSTNSRVYFSLLKTDPIRLMPPAGKLHQQKIDAVRNWIDQGAMDN